METSLRRGWTPLAAMFRVFGRLYAEPSQHHTGLQPRRALAQAHTHRVMTAHPVEVAASARRNRKGTPSGSSFRLPLAMTGHFGGFGAGLRQVMAS
jgi:hypothetical protein